MRRIKTLLFSAITLALSGGQAVAGAPIHMPTGNYTSQPIGHYDYCRKYKEDCSLRVSKNTAFKLTKPRWKQLIKVNSSINHKISPVTDLNYFGKDEVWAYPQDGFGDCEDYVLMKRKLLINAGWPASNLLITVVRQPNGEGHAVLTAVTSMGDFILDNVTDKVSRWNKTQYTFIKRQAWNHSGKWQNVNDPRMVVGSTN